MRAQNERRRFLTAPPHDRRFNLHITPVRMAAVLTALALGLRLINIGGRPLWLDEAFSAWFSDQSFDYLWHVVPTYEAHPPLFYSLLKLWRGAVGEGHAALRGMSVLLGTLTVPIVMLISLEQERQEPTGRPLLRSGVAGFLAACSPMLMVIDQEPRPYPLQTLAYAIAILCLLRLVRQFKAGGSGSWPLWALLGASASLLCWSHALGILYAACLALALLPAWLAAPLPRRRLIRGITTEIAVTIIYIPCLLLLSGRAHDWGTSWLRWEPSMLLQLLVLYTIPVEVLTIGSAIAALAMVLLLKRALAFTWSSKGWVSDRLMLLLCLGPPLGAALISAIFEPVFLARTLAATLVPAYLMIAGAIARSEPARERRMITAAICITLVPTAVLVALRPPEERWDLLSNYLQQNVSSHDQVWLYPADSALPLAALGRPIPGIVRPIPEHFPTMHFKGLIRAGWPAVVSLTPAQAGQFAADPSIRDVPVVWLVTRQSGIFDPAGDVPAALARLRRPGPLTHWGYIEARPYYRR
jgi:mannosyltransferase